MAGGALRHQAPHLFANLRPSHVLAEQCPATDHVEAEAGNLLCHSIGNRMHRVTADCDSFARIKRGVHTVMVAMDASGDDIRDRLLTEARRRGWAAAGITTLDRFGEAEGHALDAIAAGRMDGMPWFTAERVTSSARLDARLPWAQSIIALAWPYAPGRPLSSADGRSAHLGGRVAAYACLTDATDANVDYHDLLAQQCEALLTWLRAELGPLRAKSFIDHGWALDRAVAVRAGLGFTGKNANLITLEAGSYVLLAAIAVSITLAPTPPSRRDCGTCTACIPACPTGAIIAPGVIDARRCISYLTIEHKGSIPPELRPAMGTWAFGCDLCQEACPINHRLAPQPAGNDLAVIDLIDCLALSDGEFMTRFAGTPLERTGRAGLARNSAIALGNSGDDAALPALAGAADGDPDPVVREAAIWGMDRITMQRR